MAYSITEAAPLEFKTFKLGQEGWPVVACQITLNSHFTTPVLVTDGYFGKLTEKVGREVQAACHVEVDGVLGPETQKAFTIAKCRHAEKTMTPPGLLQGICNIESSYSWPCVSLENSNGTHDYGVTQESLHAPSAAQLEVAFNPDAAGHLLAGEMRGFHNAYVTKVGSQRAWELAALSHNWPAAAIALATGHDDWLNRSEDWLTQKGYATGRAYTEHYVQVACEQVTSWKVS